jgi:hypothetical protein
LPAKLQSARLRAARLKARAAQMRHAAQLVLAESREVLARARNTMQTTVNRRALRKLESKKK